VLTDLPAKVRQVIALPSDDARDLLERERAIQEEAERRLEAARVALELAKASEDDEAYQAAVRLLRDASAAAFTEISKIRHETALAKVPSVLEHLENVGEDSKCVVFAHHKDVVALLRDGLERLGTTPPCKVVVITGDTPLAERQAAVDAFQTDPEVRFIIGTIGAMGVGLTLTASSHVVFAELDWVPGNISQAEDRCHRIGQRDSVLVQHIVLDGSIDARLAKTIVEKQAVIDQALDVEHAPREEQPDVVEHVLNPLALDLRSIVSTHAAQSEATSQENSASLEGERAATEDTTRLEILAEAETITPEQIAAVHSALEILAGLDFDWAQEQNGIGFNKVDGRIGHSLAEQSRLTPKQAALGRKVLKKYRRQVPPDLYTTIFGG
jgi:hypothetical protein